MSRVKYRLRNIKDINSIKTKVDYSFQSKFRWGLKEQRSFIHSILSGIAVSPIIIADVDECLSRSVYQRDVDYYQSCKDQGYIWIIIDGNNRKQTIEQFLDDKFSILSRSESYMDVNGNALNVSKESKFSDLPSSLCDVIRNSELLCYEYIEASRENLSSIFLAINDGIELNPQEKRNAKDVPIAKYIRDFSKKFDGMFTNFFPKFVGRRFGDELIAKLSIYITRGKGSYFIGNKMIDSSYVISSQEEKNWKIIEKSLKKSFIMAEKYLPKNISKSNFFDFNVLLRELEERSYKIVNESLFTERYYEIIKEFLVTNYNHTVYIKNDKNNINQKIIWKEATRKMSESEDFIPRLYTLMYFLFRDGTPSFLIQLDKNRTATETQRIEVWIRDGKKESLSEILDGSKFHADHDTRHTDGGKTITSNINMTRKEAHREKTRKENSKAA